MNVLAEPVTERECGNADSVIRRTIKIEFPINRWNIDSAYSDNGSSLRELHQLMQDLRDNRLLMLDTLKVSGYASPDGLLPKNRELSLRRAVNMYRYLNKECGVADSMITFGKYMVAWDLFRTLISETDYAWRDDALEILSRGSDHSAVDNTRRMNRLKRLAGGEAWRVVRRDVLPRLRSALVVSAVITVRQPEPADTVIVSEREYVPLDVQDVVADGITGQDADTSTTYVLRESDYDRFAIKTNCAYLVAGVANIGAEYAMGRQWSIDVPLVYSPYTIARTYRMRFLYLQPELRFWTDKAFRGHFFGVHAHAGVFNVSVDSRNRYQSEKGFYGGGISYGYSLPVGQRWSMEFTVGVGYAYTKYCTYYNVHNGMKYVNDKPYNYIGVDKLGINVIYRFGDKTVKRKEVRL